jgi:NADPH-dependent 2,4-dienoyl-CoA reductase/sulfur reductase-like enzyme
MVKTRELQMRRAGVDIRYNVEVTAEFVRRFNPDALIVALGAEPLTPPIDGLREGNVIFANDLPLRLGEVGERVAVIGGGLVGCETALHLATLGKTVTVLEMGLQIAPDANPRHRPILLRELETRGIDILPETRALIIHHLGVTAARRGVETTVEADTVIIAAGQKPLATAADALRGICAETALVGDCVAAKNIREAVFRGYHAALDL